MTKKTDKRVKIKDWTPIEKEYIAGQLSVREISRQNDISEAAIRKKAKERGWERDLSQVVRKRTHEKLVRDSVRNNDATVEEITEAASERGANVVRLHREDIAKMKAMEQKLLEELGDSPKKTWVGQYQGEVITKDLEITVTDRCQALNNLANVQHKRIQLERQAYSLDSDSGSENEPDAVKITVKRT